MSLERSGLGELLFMYNNGYSNLLVQNYKAIVRVHFHSLIGFIPKLMHYKLSKVLAMPYHYMIF